MTEGDAIEKYYEDLRSDDRIRYEDRKSKVYELVPGLEELDAQISTAALDLAVKNLGRGTDITVQIDRLNSSLMERRRQLLARYGVQDNYLKPVYHCSICEDRGYVDGHRCSCYLPARIHVVYGNSPYYRSLEKENFDTFDINVYPEDYVPAKKATVRQLMTGVMRECRKYADTFPAGASLLFTGDVGTGKTFMSNCIAKTEIDRGYSVCYLSASEFFDNYADHEFRHTDTPRFRDMLNSDLLIIDDLGTEVTGGSFHPSALFQIINKRRMDGQSTIISTNLDMSGLTERYNSRVTSRIMESYRVYRFYGPDIRTARAIEAYHQ